MPSSSLLNRFSVVRKRSYARHLDLFLTASFLRSTDGCLEHISQDEYRHFLPTAGSGTAYVRSYQVRTLSQPLANGQSVQSLDTAIRQWRA